MKTKKGNKTRTLQCIVLHTWDICRSNKTMSELALVESSHAAAQFPLHVAPSRVQVTSEDNFWTTMLRVRLLCDGSIGL